MRTLPHGVKATRARSWFNSGIKQKRAWRKGTPRPKPVWTGSYYNSLLVSFFAHHTDPRGGVTQQFAHIILN